MPPMSRILPILIGRPTVRSFPAHEPQAVSWLFSRFRAGAGAICGCAGP